MEVPRSSKVVPFNKFGAFQMDYFDFVLQFIFFYFRLFSGLLFEESIGWIATIRCFYFILEIENDFQLLKTFVKFGKN